MKECEMNKKKKNLRVHMKGETESQTELQRLRPPVGTLLEHHERVLWKSATPTKVYKSPTEASASLHSSLFDVPETISQ